MKIWVLEHGLRYEGGVDEWLFSSREKALEFRKRFIEVRWELQDYDSPHDWIHHPDKNGEYLSFFLRNLDPDPADL